MIALAWVSLIGLAAGEAGFAIGRRAGVEPRWAWPASAAGWLALAVHMLVAMGVHHGWSHAAAIDETKLLTERVYGVAWGGGVYVNYAFLGVWLAYVAWWKKTAAAVPAWLLYTWRVMVAIVVANAAVVFAAPARQFAGALVTAAIVASWWLSGRGARARR
jgi:hypothetical protein